MPPPGHWIWWKRRDIEVMESLAVEVLAAYPVSSHFVKEFSLTGTTDLYIIILLWCAKNGTASM